MDYFKEGTKVIVHSLGEATPGEFKAIVRGISSTYPEGCVYIIEIVDPFNADYGYSCCGIVSACVREDV
jgi:hypothetical protein